MTQPPHRAKPAHGAARLLSLFAAARSARGLSHRHKHEKFVDRAPTSRAVVGEAGGIATSASASRFGWRADRGRLKVSRWRARRTVSLEPAGHWAGRRGAHRLHMTCAERRATWSSAGVGTAWESLLGLGMWPTAPRELPIIPKAVRYQARTCRVVAPSSRECCSALPDHVTSYSSRALVKKFRVGWALKPLATALSPIRR